MLRRIADMYRAAFRGLSPAAWRVSLAFLINRAGTMVIPFLGLYLTQEVGMSKVRAGLVLAAFGLGAILGVLLGSRLTVRLGTEPVMVGSLLVSGALFLALGRFERFESIVALVLLLSIAAESYRPAAMAALAEAATPDTLARTMGLGRLTANLGMAIGPAIGGFLAEVSYQLLFIADALTGWLAAVFLIATSRRVTHRAPTRPSSDGMPRLGGAWRDRPLLLLMTINFLASLIFFQLLGTFPLYLLERYGLDEAWIGIVLSINCAIIVLTEMPLVGALERRHPVRVFACGCFFTGVGFGIVMFGATPWFAVLSVVVWTLGEMTAAPFSSTAVASRAEEGRQGEYMGLLMLSFSVGHLLAPPIGMWVYEHPGPEWLWSGCLVLGPLLALAAYRLAPRFPWPAGSGEPLEALAGPRAME